MSIRFCKCHPDAIVSCYECAATGEHAPAGTQRGELSRGDLVWVDPDPMFANYSELRPRKALVTAVPGKDAGAGGYVHVNYGYGQYRGFAVPPQLVRRIGRHEPYAAVVGTHDERYWTKQ